MKKVLTSSTSIIWLIIWLIIFSFGIVNFTPNVQSDFDSEGFQNTFSSYGSKAFKRYVTDIETADYYCNLPNTSTEWCLTDAAINLNDPAICLSNISCVSKFAKEKGDLEICDILKTKNEIRECVNWIKYGPNYNGFRINQFNLTMNFGLIIFYLILVGTLIAILHLIHFKKDGKIYKFIKLIIVFLIMTILFKLFSITNHLLDKRSNSLAALTFEMWPIIIGEYSYNTYKLPWLSIFLTDFFYVYTIAPILIFIKKLKSIVIVSILLIICINLLLTGFFAIIFSSGIG